jgi:predicted nucleic acid-binding protein
MTAADPAPRAFVDTNVLVYAFANDDAARAPIAQGLLDRLMAGRLFQTSTQVLQELFVTLTRKGQRTASANEALASLDLLAKFPVFQVDYPAIRAAGELSAHHKLSFWDALIIVSAARSGATHLYSEDLQHGRTILGVKILNPFRRN